MLPDEQLSRYPLRQPLFPGAPGLPILNDLGSWTGCLDPIGTLSYARAEAGASTQRKERALHDAQQVIRDAHGGEVVFRRPEIHTYLGTERDSWLEPVMFVRIKCPHADARDILKELSRREIKIFETDAAI